MVSRTTARAICELPELVGLDSGPIVSQLINDFEGSDKVIDMDTLNHHSESKAFQKRFSEGRDKLIEEFVQTGNPFVGYKEITSLKSKIVCPCSSDIYKVEELGNASPKNFDKEVFTDNKRSVFIPMKTNNTEFFKKTTVKDTTKVLAKKSSDIIIYYEHVYCCSTKFQSFLNGKSHYHHLR